MWTPPNPTRLPSREETLHCRNALSLLSQQLASLHSSLATNDDRQLSLSKPIADLQAKLSALQDELKTLQDEYADTDAQREQVEDEMERRSAWIAPQRRLPLEMLAEIFVFHVMEDWKAPIIDSSVCKRWRTAALDTPRVWSYLRFPPTIDIPQELVLLWLERAGNVPLHVHINQEDVTDDILQLYRNAYCLKFRPWPKFLAGQPFSKVEKLILDHKDATLEQLERDVLFNMPLLKNLHLHWFRLSRRPLFSWSWDLPALEEFHFAGATWAWIDAVELVKDSLVRLSLDIGDVGPPPSSITIRPIHLPKLRYLAYGAQSRTILMNDSARVPIVSKVIRAPKLEVFEDHSVIPLDNPLPAINNWDFPGLKHYIGGTSREIASVKVLYPHVECMAFVVDRETGVLDVATLIDDAREGQLDNLRCVELFLGDELKAHPMIQSSLKQFKEVRGKSLTLLYLPTTCDTPFQKCLFGFSCCESKDTGDGSGTGSSTELRSIHSSDFHNHRNDQSSPE